MKMQLSLNKLQLCVDWRRDSCWRKMKLKELKTRRTNGASERSQRLIQMMIWKISYPTATHRKVYQSLDPDQSPHHHLPRLHRPSRQSLHGKNLLILNGTPLPHPMAIHMTSGTLTFLNQNLTNQGANLPTKEAVESETEGERGDSVWMLQKLLIRVTENKKITLTMVLTRHFLSMPYTLTK